MNLWGLDFPRVGLIEIWELKIVEIWGDIGRIVKNDDSNTSQERDPQKIQLQQRRCLSNDPRFLSFGSGGGVDGLSCGGVDDRSCDDVGCLCCGGGGGGEVGLLGLRLSRSYFLDGFDILIYVNVSMNFEWKKTIKLRCWLVNVLSKTEKQNGFSNDF